MTTYTIHLNEREPVPRKSRSGKSTTCHPLYWLLEKLEVGQSFVYPASTSEAFPRLRSIIQCYAKSQWNRATPLKFVTRTVESRDRVARLWIKREQ
jgi:hypothetical protein